MKPIPDDFLSSRLPIVGLIGYTVYSGERLVATECFSKSVYPTAVQQMLTAVAQTGRARLPASEQFARYCWTFECLRVYVAVRPDGACLALLVENNPGAQLLRIQETVQAFLGAAEG